MWKTMSRPSSTASAPAEQITSVPFTSSTCKGRRAGGQGRGQAGRGPGRGRGVSMAGWHREPGTWLISCRQAGSPRFGSFPQLPAGGLMRRAGCLTVRKTEDSSAPVTR
jgi:hypothetical protein